MTLKNKILAFLSSEEPINEEVVALAEQKLQDGVIIVSDDFAEGAAVFIKSEEDGEENVKLPVGEYSLEDGKKLVISEEGIIASIGEAQEEEAEEVQAEEPKEEELEKEDDEQPQPEESVEELKAIIVALEAELAELKAKEELAAEEVAEEVIEEEVNLSSEEAEAEPQPIVHVPVDKSEKKPGFYFGKQE